MPRRANFPDEEKNVKSVEKALNVFLLFTQEMPELSHTEIAKAMGWGTATTARLLNTLQNRGFLIRNEASGKYMLGNIFYYLGQVAKQSSNLEQISIPVLERLRDMTLETVQIFVRDGCQRVCFAQAEGLQDMRQSTRIGTYEPLCYGSTGVILLAFQKPEELGKLLGELKQACHHVNLEKLLMKVAVAKDQGYFLKKGDDDDTHVGCIAAPIYNPDGSVNACIAISTPEFRFPDDPSKFIALITQGAGEISQKLGYHGSGTGA